MKHTIFLSLLVVLLSPLTTKASEIEVIYTWSTFMPLSIEGLPEVEAVCKAHNFKCTFVYDPYQSIDTLDPELLPYAQSQDLSDELIEKGILNHFPGIAVLEDGQILGNIHLGYLEPETLEWVILRRLQ